jgi:hypothetical protein
MPFSSVNDDVINDIPGYLRGIGVVSRILQCLDEFVPDLSHRRPDIEIFAAPLWPPHQT